ncbi:MAG: hypothetical protein HMLKMBBP_00787 [Planctomycetes bacterium]|nr:hypothetical protein [Planctomycetota bacterium]
MHIRPITAALLVLALAPAARSEDKGGAAPAEETTPSGLKIKVLEAGGAGKSPKMGDPCTVSYRGWLDDGTEFDASAKHGGPATFQVGNLIAGWNEALQRMTKGARWELVIPPAIGYGAQQSGAIPPNSTLHFELTLHDFWSRTTLDASKAKELYSGVTYEIDVPAKGEAPGPDDAFELKLAAWDKEGKLLICTEMNGQSFSGRRADLALPFLKKAPDVMGPGCTARFEVPNSESFGDKPGGPAGPTTWEIRMGKTAKPQAVPKFEMPAPEKLKKTASGLQYEVIKEGPDGGKSPTLASRVTVHYAGWLTDGTCFDNSYQRAFPTGFPLRGVVTGWQEGLQLMKPGSVYKFVIPANLGYGTRGSPPTIPPNATLVFQVELIEVQ